MELINLEKQIIENNIRKYTKDNNINEGSDINYNLLTKNSADFIREILK
jgi:hypothetical protein